MQTFQFKAYAVTSEIDLNQIATRCGISKKYTWEEPLTLQGAALESILGQPVAEGQKAMLFSFGSVVFINLPPEKHAACIRYLEGIKPVSDWGQYQDDYALHISDETPALTDEYAIVNEYAPFYPELIAIVLAKSVALERVEVQLEKILDSLESLIERLENGNFQIGDKKLAKVTANIARHEFDSVSYIMILDKPDIAWANTAADEFYNQMSEFFELADRYEIIKNKTAVSNNIISGFTSISHALRGLRVELIIVLLIVAEVVLMILELFR
jgi:uncharacterized Rmd1/YagE family protein